MVRVELTPTELLMGQTIGTMRQATIELSQNKTCQRYDEGVLGALGEIAVAKALNMFWDSSLNTFKSRGDVGDVEVRTTDGLCWSAKSTSALTICSAGCLAARRSSAACTRARQQAERQRTGYAMTSCTTWIACQNMCRIGSKTHSIKLALCMLRC